jgi:hypothetical protein
MSEFPVADRDLIDSYLDDLASRLHGPPTRARRILQEAESHLRDAAEAAAAAAPGTDPIRSSAIQQQVIDGFGTPAQVARAHNRALLRPKSLLGPVSLLAGQVVAVGLLAIGASALVLAALARAVSRTSMFADPFGTHFSAASCAHWFGLHPGAGDCARAYTLETAHDAVAQRAMAGILGLLVLGAVVLLRRWKPGWSHSVIPRGATPALALVGFLPAALGLFGVGVDRVIVSDGRGAGMWFADGAVSAIAAVICLVALLWQVLGGRARTPLTGSAAR